MEYVDYDHDVDSAAHSQRLINEIIHLHVLALCWLLAIDPTAYTIIIFHEPKLMFLLIPVPSASAILSFE